MVAIFDRFGFKMRSKINGFEFYSVSTNSLTSSLQYITESTGQQYFDFEIVSNNPGFGSFTEMPANGTGQLLYDSSAPSNIFENGKLTLVTSLPGKTAGLLTGILTLRFDDILKYHNDNGFSNFIISLNARNTQWQYFIVNKSSLQLYNPLIKGYNNNIVFDLPEKVTVQPGEEAFLFSSGENFLPLSEKPRYRFSLIDRLPPAKTGATTNITARIILKELPHPDHLNLKIVTINGNQYISSPMYVFV